MGTNYYIEHIICTECGASEKIHIGKVSAGWKFLFATHKERGLTDVTSWLKYLKTRQAEFSDILIDESASPYPYSELLSLIISKQNGRHEVPRDLLFPDHKNNHLDEHGFAFAPEGEWC